MDLKQSLKCIQNVTFADDFSMNTKIEKINKQFTFSTREENQIKKNLNSIETDFNTTLEDELILNHIEQVDQIEKNVKMSLQHKADKIQDDFKKDTGAFCAKCMIF